MRRIVIAIAAAVALAGCHSTPPTAPGAGGGNGGGGNGGGGGGAAGETLNAPPVVKSVVASDIRVEVGLPVTLTATVEDAETPVASLQFSWTLPPGSMTETGNGSTIAWTPAAGFTTPADFTITVTVTETYTSAGQQKQNTATGTVPVHVNNSPKELADLSLRFLANFADSKVSPETCVAEFTPSCSGKKDELTDVTNNRHDFQILSSSLRHKGIDPTASKTKATVHTDCAFTSRVITKDPWSCDAKDCPYDSIQSVKGDCYTSNVYEQGRWWLCESHFNPAPGLAPTAFERAFFGIRDSEHP
jgi:hypothetical protein